MLTHGTLRSPQAGNGDGEHAPTLRKRAAGDGVQDEEGEHRAQKQPRLSAAVAAAGHGDTEGGEGEEKKGDDSGPTKEGSHAGDGDAGQQQDHRKPGRRMAGWLRKKLRKRALAANPPPVPGAVGGGGDEQLLLRVDPSMQQRPQTAVQGPLLLRGALRATAGAGLAIEEGIERGRGNNGLARATSGAILAGRVQSLPLGGGNVPLPSGTMGVGGAGVRVTHSAAAAAIPRPLARVTATGSLPAIIPQGAHLRESFPAAGVGSTVSSSSSLGAVGGSRTIAALSHHYSSSSTSSATRSVRAQNAQTQTQTQATASVPSHLASSTTMGTLGQQQQLQTQQQAQESSMGPPPCMALARFSPGYTLPRARIFYNSTFGSGLSKKRMCCTIVAFEN